MLVRDVVPSPVPLDSVWKHTGPKNIHGETAGFKNSLHRFRDCLTQKAEVDHLPPGPKSDNTTDFSLVTGQW